MARRKRKAKGKRASVGAQTRPPTANAAGTGTPHSHDAVFKKTFGVPEHAST